MEPFRQQATTISNMKRNVLERLENTDDRLKELQAKLDEKREQSKIFMDEMAPKGEDLKKYVAHLKIKSITYKRNRAELAALKAEIGVLQRTAVILKAQVFFGIIEKMINSFEKKKKKHKLLSYPSFIYFRQL